MLELSVKQMLTLAVPLIKKTMGKEVGEWAEQVWNSAGWGDDTEIFGIIMDGKLVAIGGLGAEATKQTIYLGYLAVDPMYQRLGFASRLLAFVEKRARRMGYKKMLVETYSGVMFYAASKFYVAKGYTEIGRIRNFLDNGDDAVFFAKELRQE